MQCPCQTHRQGLEAGSETVLRNEKPSVARSKFWQNQLWTSSVHRPDLSIMMAAGTCGDTSITALFCARSSQSSSQIVIIGRGGVSTGYQLCQRQKELTVSLRHVRISRCPGEVGPVGTTASLAVRRIHSDSFLAFLH